MDGCLLCLGLKQEFEGTILINSNKWNELNVNYVLKKYLWSMNHVTANSWICTTCWTELFDFHKFYTRIEEGHRNLGILTTNVVEKEVIPSNSGGNSINEKIESPINELDENPIDLLLENLVDGSEDILNESAPSDNQSKNNMKEEQKPMLKIELNDESFSDNPLLKTRKRGRPRRDASNDTNVLKTTLSKTKYKKGKVEHLPHDVDMSIGSSSKTKKRKVKESPLKEIELDENPIDLLLENLVDESKDILNESGPSDNRWKNNMIEEQKPMLKIELNDESFSDNSLLKTRKRGRPRRDASNNTNVLKATLSKTKKYKKGKVEHLPHDVNMAIGSSTETKKPKVKESPLKEIEISTVNTAGQVKNLEIKNKNDFKIAPEDSNFSVDKLSSSSNKSDEETTNRIEVKSSASPSKTISNAEDKFLKENFKITCFLCDIPLETFYKVRKHFEEHHTERGYIQCCNKKFYRRSILIDHVRYHLNPNYFKCSKCDAVMEDRRRLMLHIKTHEINNGKNHRCEICGKGFLILGVLNRHKMIHVSEEEKPFTCSECGKKFASNYMLNTHYTTTHLKKYVKICETCGKCIRNKDVFKRHMLQHEGKTDPVGCDVCGLLLTDNKALKRHKEIIHPIGGQKSYTCPICSKTSPSLRAHKLHVQFTHERGHNYKCTICDKTFKRAPSLKDHMASHTGTTLYTCPWCPKTFNSNANMHHHRKRVHPKEWEETSRKRYSGKLPPYFKPPTTTEPAE